MSNYTSNIPVSYDFINLYQGNRNPSAIHTRNSALFNYYVKYLFQKLVSVFEFDGLPSTWADNYFRYVLLGYGFIAIFSSDEYGVIPQQCTLSDTHTIFYQPRRVIVTNPVFGSKVLNNPEDCELIRLQPDFGSPMDIVAYYADLMAIAMETASVNLMNSKASYIFFAQNKAVAETYKQMYDEISSGKPFTVLDKDLQNEDGSRNWDFFTQNVGQNYITDRILQDMKTIEDQFNTRIGIPNANTQKRERLISSEVESNDVDTTALINVWLESMKDGIRKVNEHFGLNLSVKYRYNNYYDKGVDYDSKEEEGWLSDQE